MIRARVKKTVSSANTPDFLLTYIERQGHLHVIAKGHSNPNSILASGMEIVERSQTLGFEYVLIEDKFEGPRMEPIDIYAWLSEISKMARQLLKAVAIVDEHLGETRQFTESVAVNRGLNFALFLTVSDAEHWLLGQIGDD